MTTRMWRRSGIALIGLLLLVVSLAAAGFNSVTAQRSATAQATAAAKATSARSTAAAAATKAATAQTKAASAATAAATAAASTAGHPTHIHMGTCANLNPTPEYPLPNTLPIKVSSKGTVAPTAGASLAPMSVTMESTSKTVNVSLDALLRSAHAINVHLSSTKIQVYIACGNIAGPVNNDTLVIGLQQQNNSGYSGVAILKRDGSKTDVTVYLAPGLSGIMPAGTPAA
jgi:hypothetical protein